MKSNQDVQYQQPQNIGLMGQAIITQHSGPLPSADEFRRYNEALPGTAGKLLDWAEKQADHRRAYENKELDSRVKLSHTGQNCAFIIAVLALTATVVCAALGKSTTSVVAALVALIGTVPAFLSKKK